MSNARPDNPPRARAQPLPAVQAAQPKWSLAELDQEFLKDMDNMRLDPVANLFAGRLHQLVLHILQLQAEVVALKQARPPDLKPFNEKLERITALLSSFPKPTPPENGARPPGPQEAEPVAARPPAGGDPRPATPAEKDGTRP